jgi:hypothetical protein
LSEKLDGPEYIAMIRDSHGIHSQAARFIKKVPDSNSAIQKTKFGMNVEMGKRRFGVHIDLI